MLDLLNNPLVFAITLGCIVIAITIHEFAHAWMANYLGDPTPKIQGRLTLNPLAHLDPLGTLLLVIMRFGWGKPVQFDPYNLRNPRRDAALISFAGPVSNLVLASITSLAFRFLPIQSELVGSVMITLISYNVMLAIFNLIPIHPLDGGKILVGLLPQKDAYAVDNFLNQYGTILLLFVILPFFGRASLVHTIISPIINMILQLLLGSSLGYV